MVFAFRVQVYVHLVFHILSLRIPSSGLEVQPLTDLHSLITRRHNSEMIQSPYDTDFKKAPQPDSSNDLECDDADDVEYIEYKSDGTQNKVQVARRSDADPAWCNVGRPVKELYTGAASLTCFFALLDRGSSGCLYDQGAVWKHL